MNKAGDLYSSGLRKNLEVSKRESRENKVRACVRVCVNCLENCSTNLHCASFQHPHPTNIVHLHKNESFIPVDQPKESIDKLRTYLYGLDSWEFTCVHVLSTAVKSLVLAMAVLHGKLGIKEGK